jgi:methyl-accepting chemotaxis protein
LIETTANAVEKGTLLADETTESMAEVMVGAKKAAEMMSEVADMLKANVKSMETVTADLNDVSETVDNNSATSQETAAVSEEQQAQVEMMVSLLEKFEI